MLCYKDKTFCTQTECAIFKGCHRAATDKVKAEAEKADLPLSLMAFQDCFVPREKTRERT